MRRTIWQKRGLLGAVLGAGLCLFGLTGCFSGPMEVVSTLPADGGAGVPTETVLEVTFSQPPEDLDGFFTIDPPVEGSFQYYGSTAVFCPTMSGDGEFKTETEYTVTIGAGARGKDGGTLEEPYTFRFTTGAEEGLGFEVTTRAETVLTEDYPVIDLYTWAKQYKADGLNRTLDYEVTVYRLNEEDYLRQLYRASLYGEMTPMATDGLTEVLQFTQSGEEIFGEANYRGDIVFPETLPAGWYLASVEAPGGAVQKLLQVQDTAVYTQISGDQVVLWFNSAASGESLAGAKIELIRDPFSGEKPAYTFTADENGVLTFALPDFDAEAGSGWNAYDGKPHYFYRATAADGTVYYDVISGYFVESRRLNWDYFTFLYTDRELYRREDTIHFWGIVRPREDAPPIREVELQVGRGGEAMESLTVPVSESGIFTGEYSYTGLASGGLELIAYPAGLADEEKNYHHQIGYAYVNIADFEKPIYTGSFTAPKRYYRPGETIEAELAVDLFDGTPAANVPMSITADGGDAAEVTTNAEGRATVPLTARVKASYNLKQWYPSSMDIEAKNDFASDVNLTLSDTVYVFPTSVALEAEVTENGRGLVLQANAIDFARLPTDRQLVDDYESLLGAPAQAGVQVDVYRIEWIKEAGDWVYDRYAKRMVQPVSYRKEESLYNTVTGTTGADGSLTLPDLIPEKTKLTSYYAVVRTSTGGEQSFSIYFPGQMYSDLYGRSGHYHRFYVNNGDLNSMPGYFGNSTFTYGGTLGWQVTDNGLPVEEGRVMTNLMQGEMIASAVSGTSGSLVCDDAVMPGFYLCGAYFDGKHIYPVNPAEIHVDDASMQYDLTVTADRESYRPGETAQVTARLTDRSGAPVSGAEVAVGVVDESIFALEEQYIYLGDDLYTAIYYEYPNISASYIQHGKDIYYGEGGKGGGGGGDSLTIREDFLDTIGLYTGVTGADGTLTLSVPLPDNLTQWRLTGLAIASDDRWAQTRSQLFTTLPFRVDPVLADRFLEGDAIGFTVRSAGTGIGTEDTVQYQATITGDLVQWEQETEAPAGTTAQFTFDRLPAGAYTLTLTGHCGDYSDGVSLPFAVEQSALVLQKHAFLDLTTETLAAVEPTLFPAEVTLYSASSEPFMQGWYLLCADGSGRGDTAVALEAVRQTVSDFFGEGFLYPETGIERAQSILEDSQGYSGGIALYPYAASDPEASGRAALVAGDFLDRSELSYYLHHIVDQEGLAEPAALMGLAALDSLNESEEELLRTAAGDSGNTLRESAYLIAGLSYLDRERAQSLYDDVLVPALVSDRYGLYIPGENDYETVDNTAGALACAVLLGEEADAGEMVGYLAERGINSYGTPAGPYSAEVALFLRETKLPEGELPRVSYTLDGERHTETIPQRGALTLSLTAENWKALDLALENGEAMASVSYTGTPDDDGFENSSRVVLTSRVNTPEDQRYLGGESTISLTVELASDLPYGEYRIVQWIPSNLRFRDAVTSERVWYELDGQLLTANFYYGESTGRTFSITCTATSVYDGPCVLEHAYAYNLETMEGSRTDRGTFDPVPDKEN